MIAMKFGGSSVGTGERMLGVANIVRSFLDKKPLVVISAMQGVTDMLLALADDFLKRDREAGQQKLEMVYEKHIEVVRKIIKNPKRKKDLERTISGLFHQLEEIVHGVYLLRELTPKSIALISSFGERMSVPLLAGILQEIGVEAEDFDARKLVRTNNDFLQAAVDMRITEMNVRKCVFPHWKRGIVPVITGFIGSCEEGLTTTLGRGGSDYSGAIFGACFHAEEIWIWTDVSGIYSADPRIVPNASVLKNVSYEEASEMSYFGAKVIHPKTMMPALMKKIPVRIKNTFAPDDFGTLISEKRHVAHPVRVVTAITKQSVVSIQGSGLIVVSGLTARIFTVAEKANIHPLMFSQASSGYNMSLVMGNKDSERFQTLLQKEFEYELRNGALDQIGILKNVAVVSIVGSGMRGTPGIAGTLFSALGKAKINVIAVAQGSSELNISFVVDERYADKAVKLIHTAFSLHSR